MKKCLLIFGSILFLFEYTSAQFSLEEFLEEPFNYNYSSIISKLKDKNTIEETILKYKSVVYYDYIEPVSIKVGYMFDVDESQKGKVIMNGKEKPEDAAKLFDFLLKALEKKFSSNYSKAQFGDTRMINWKGLKDFSIILSKQANKTILTIVKK